MEIENIIFCSYCDSVGITASLDIFGKCEHCGEYPTRLGKFVEELREEIEDRWDPEGEWGQED